MDWVPAVCLMPYLVVLSVLSVLPWKFLDGESAVWGHVPSNPPGILPCKSSIVSRNVVVNKQEVEMISIHNVFLPN